MIRQPVIFFFVPFKRFFLSAFDTAIQFFFVSVTLVITLYDKKVFSVSDVLRIGIAGITLTKRKVIDSIQQIAFSHAVIA